MEFTLCEHAVLTLRSFPPSAVSGAGAQRQTAQSLLSPLSPAGVLDDGRSEDTISIAGSIDETPKADKSERPGHTPLKARGGCRCHGVVHHATDVASGSPLLLCRRPADPRGQRPQVPGDALEQHQEVHGVQRAHAGLGEARVQVPRCGSQPRGRAVCRASRRGRAHAVRCARPRFWSAAPMQCAASSAIKSATTNRHSATVLRKRACWSCRTNLLLNVRCHPRVFGCYAEFKFVSVLYNYMPLENCGGGPINLTRSRQRVLVRPKRAKLADRRTSRTAVVVVHGHDGLRGRRAEELATPRNRATMPMAERTPSATAVNRICPQRAPAPYRVELRDALLRQMAQAVTEHLRHARQLREDTTPTVAVRPSHCTVSVLHRVQPVAPRVGQAVPSAAGARCAGRAPRRTRRSRTAKS